MTFSTTFLIVVTPNKTLIQCVLIDPLFVIVMNESKYLHSEGKKLVDKVFLFMATFCSKHGVNLLGS